MRGELPSLSIVERRIGMGDFTQCIRYKSTVIWYVSIHSRDEGNLLAYHNQDQGS